MTEREFLLRIPVGNLYVGDAFYARRRVGSRWLQARTADVEKGYVTGCDRDGKIFTVFIDNITRIDRTKSVWTSPEAYRPRARKTAR